MPREEYDNTNKGVLWNAMDRKRPGKKDRDYSGKINFNGEEFWLSAWINTSREGKKYLSIKVEAPVEPRRAAGNGDADSQPEYNDEIPF